jgi:hypothetical protein
MLNVCSHATNETRVVNKSLAIKDKIGKEVF